MATTVMNEIAQETATVFVIEDEPAVRQAVRSLTESMGLAVKEFECVDDFLSDKDDGIGCIVADIRLRGLRGVELLNRLSESGRRRPVVIITGNATTSTVVRAMQLGAVTVLDKPIDPNELWQAIEQAIRDDKLLRTKSAQIANLKARFSLLTDQERMVLRLIVSGCINKQISKQLDVSVRTVESRRQQIFKKTEAKNLGELMWHAMLLRAEGCSWFSDDDEEAGNSEECAKTT